MLPLDEKGNALSKFNTVGVRAAVRGPIQTVATATGTTYEGAPGYARDAKSELFLLAVSNMVGEGTFYEGASQRDSRYSTLVRQVAVEDLDWTTRFARWLRTEANMRSAALVLAAEAAKASLDAGRSGSRAIVDAVLQRADEPGEMIGYWLSTYGRKIPKPVKRGVADGVRRLYSERSLAKYDSDTHAFRFGDVIDLVHPTPAPDKPWQGVLFGHALDRRHGRDNDIPEELMVLRARAELLATPVDQRRALFSDGERAREVLKSAGMTWESVAGWLQGSMNSKVWEALVPSMGLMALTRNLRSFDEAGMSEQVAAEVAARLMNAEEVARSRQFPFRFYAAFKNVGSLRWSHALETALTHSLSNVPTLPGRTLVLVDQSPSMFPGIYYSGANSKSDIAFAEKAALFGAAVALRAENADLYGYGFKSYKVPFRKGDAVLRTMQKFHQENGTDTLGAMQRWYDGHHRIIVVTDEQTAFTDPYSRSRYGLSALKPIESVIPAHVPVYTWNIAGYQHGHGAGRNWHTFAGMSDAAFRLVPLLEAGKDADWPWMETEPVR